MATFTTGPRTIPEAPRKAIDGKVMPKKTITRQSAFQIDLIDRAILRASKTV